MSPSYDVLESAIIFAMINTVLEEVLHGYYVESLVFKKFKTCGVIEGVLQRLLD